MVDRYGDQAPRTPPSQPYTAPAPPPSGASSVRAGETPSDSGMLRDASLRDTMDETRPKGQQAVHQAQQTLGQGADRAADAADRLAGTLRERGDQLPGGERTTQMARQAASAIEQGADYLRETNPSEWRADVEDMIRRHPTQSMAVGLAIGFLIARAFR